MTKVIEAYANTPPTVLQLLRILASNTFRRKTFWKLQNELTHVGVRYQYPNTLSGSVTRKFQNLMSSPH